ncbi:MAG TPA: hypothetical protein VEY51_18505 [Chondromyces sp.]|nr:hypothetical protein [Chondromyces sp.]
MGRTKLGNANAQRNNNKKQKNGFPKVTTFAQMEKERMQEEQEEK